MVVLPVWARSEQGNDEVGRFGKPADERTDVISLERGHQAYFTLLSKTTQ